MKKKKKITIWVCEDDESLWEYQKEILSEHFPKALVKFFLNAGFAVRETGSPDFIIIDVGGMQGSQHAFTCGYDIKALANRHPGAIFIINSAIGEYAKYVYNELKPELQAVSEWCDGCNMCGKIFDIIKDYT